MKFEARIHPTSKDSFRSWQAVSKLVRMGVGVGAVPTTTCQGDVIITRSRLRLPDDSVLIRLYATCLHWQRALMLFPHIGRQGIASPAHHVHSFG